MQTITQEQMQALYGRIKKLGDNMSLSEVQEWNAIIKNTKRDFVFFENFVVNMEVKYGKESKQIATYPENVSIEQIVSCFPNGKERYQTEAVFQNIMRKLHKNTPSFEVIEELLQMVKKQSELIAQYNLNEK